ncbi:hypothetical protein LINPERPRIM_LOCUS37307 [Linum perenne]
MRVITSIAQRLWGYEGPVTVSKLADNFFLMEFKSVQLCDWVLGRSWHVHNSGMVMRRWEKGIKPIDFSLKATPEWIELQGVPPELITVDAVSWMSSELGKPLNRFVRDGTNVRVCILRDKAIPCPAEMKVNNKGERVTIPVLQHKPREYKRPVIRTEWRKAQTENVGKVVTTQAPELIVQEKGVPDTPKGLQILVEDVQASSSAVESEMAVASTSKRTKKRNKKKNKKVVGEVSNEEALTQSKSLPNKTIHSGNEAAPSMEGTASPVSGSSVQETGGGIGNVPEVSLQMEGAPIQHAKSVSPMEEPKDGHLTDVTVEEDEFHVPSGRKATLGDFMPYSKPSTNKKKYAASGVKTRFKTKYR